MGHADNPTMLNHIVRRLSERLLSNRVHLKRDLGQARLRCILAAAVCGYFLVRYFLEAPADGRLPVLTLLAALYFTASWLVPPWVSRWPRFFLTRRLITIGCDCASIAVCLIIGREYALPLLALYFWVTALNGWRFGAQYMVYSGTASLTCIYSVFLLSPYWTAQSVIVYGVFISLLAVTVVGCFVLHRKLVDRSDSEHDQALIRIVITSLFMIYLAALWHLKGIEAPVPFSNLAFVSTAVVLVSLALFLSISLKPGVSLPRRVVGMLVDLGASTYGLIYGGEYGAPMLAVYLWVTMGNGFRYGPAYLYGATALSLTGFALAVILVPFWGEHVFLAVTFFIVLSALPLYMVSLIRKLNAAIDSANEANRAKTHFLANMSHELRTPLNAVIGVSDLLIDANASDYQRKLAGRIQSSAQLLLGMIERILDISKIETGRIELLNERLDLYSLLRDVAAVFEMQAEAKGVSFELLISPRVPVMISGDAGRLKQVLVNLVGNACKFTERGYVRLHVHVNSVGAEGSCLVFDIQDSGIGIPEARRRKIFEPFVQADVSITRRYGGTGLGMSIARQLVEAMHGEISLVSEEYKGSTFTVKLPLSAVTDGSGEASASGVPDAGIVVLGANQRPPGLAALPRALSRRIVYIADARNLLAWLSQRSHQSPVLVLIDEQQVNEGVSKCIAAARRGEVPVEWAVLSGRCDAAGEIRNAGKGLGWTLEKPLKPGELGNVLHYLSLDQRPENKIVSLADYYAARQGGRLKVLVAEDNEINRLVINELLSRVGHEVVMVQDGEQALDALDAHEFDVALLDLNMPKISGIDVVRTCRFRQDLRELPIVILSADATTGARKACQEAGADIFVTKPLDAKYLLELLADIGRGGGPSARPEVANAGARPAGRDNLEMVNPDVINQFRDSGIENEFFRNLLDQFAEQGEQQLLCMRRAISGGDVRTLTEQVHRLKGGAAYFGASRLAGLCEDIEKRIGDCGRTRREELVDQLEELFHKSCEAVSERINIEAAD